MTEEDVREIGGWQYEEPYQVYAMDNDLSEAEALKEMLDRRSPHYAVRDEQDKLIGFFSYGTSSQPWEHDEPMLFTQDNLLTVGLGMRPEMTGKGLGLAFVQAGLAFAREEFAPQEFQLYVMPFNERAIRVYERAGFRRERVLTVKNIHGEIDFVEMRRRA